MLRSALILPVLLVFLSFPAFAHEIVADSTIRAATVYTNRATLTRQAVVDIKSGAHVIIFNNLPIELLPDSLRIEGTAAAAVKFGALSSKIINSLDLVAPKEKELNDQLRALQDQRKGVEAEKAALSAQHTFLDTLTKQGALRTQENIAELKLDATGWAGAATAIYTGIGDILKAQNAADISLRDIDEKIALTQTELNQIQTGARSHYQIAVPYEAATDTKLTINLSYQVPNATWSPLYDARLDTKTGKLELTQYGAVRQSTSEDWIDVTLTLSTAQPSRGAGLPDLDPFWVNLFVPQPVAPTKAYNMAGTASPQMVLRKSLLREEMMATDSGVAEMAPAPMAAEFVTAQIETGGFVSEYKIPGPSTVRADGTDSKLMVGTFKTENKMQVHVKPQLSTDSFLVAHAKLTGDAPILPGAVSLFRDGAYVGGATLPLLRPGAERDLTFGIDDQVSIKRSVMKDERSEAGMITRETTLERHFVTEIQNLHTQSVDVHVLETTPVAQNKDIRVELVAAQTTQGYLTDVDAVKGQMEWTLPLAAKAKTAVNLGWKVSWPKDQNISGL